MRRLLIEPSTFEILPIQDKQNPYIEINHHVNRARVAEQHEALVQVLATGPNGVIVYRLPRDIKTKLPDIVFTANGALALPRLKTPLILLPNMKYPQRKAELPYLATMFAALGLRTMDYPGTEPFEGQAELKWFDGGCKAICGYGHRSTRRTFEELDELFTGLYGSDKKPTLLVLPLASADYYHLDVAMCEYAPSGSANITKCVVHKRAFSAASHEKIRDFLGPENVTVIDTSDSFCLNAVIDGSTMITHRFTDPALKPLFERLTGRRVIQVPTMEFEKSGGSVRCMTLDIV